MFQKALEESRAAQVSRRDERQEDSSQEKARRLPPARTRSRALKLDIGKHNLVCANTLQKIALKVERPTIEFISEYMVALTRRVMQELQAEGSSSPESVRSQPAAFHIQASATPNIRDKVIWDVPSSSWTVLWKVKGKKHPMTRSLPVDPTLSSEDFQAEKRRQYDAALTLWNAEDMSSRSKVAVGGQPGAESQAGH